MELNIPQRYLDCVRSNYGVNDFLNLKKSIFIKWILLDEHASWSKLVSALFAIGHSDLAHTLSKQYKNGKLMQ